MINMVSWSKISNFKTEEKMYYGIAALYQKNFFNADLLDDIIQAYSSKFSIHFNQFQFLEKDSDRVKKTSQKNKAIEYLVDPKYYCIIAHDETEKFSFSANLQVVDEQFFLPFEMTLQISSDNFNIRKAFDFFYNCFKQQAMPSYAFLVFDDKMTKLEEELTFTPINTDWMNESSDNGAREEYLFELQDIRPEFGKRIVQLYPANIIGDSMTSAIMPQLKKGLDKSWEVEKRNGATIIIAKNLDEKSLETIIKRVNV